MADFTKKESTKKEFTKKEISDYIKKNIKKGYSLETIKDVLAERRIPKRLINEAVEEISIPKARPSLEMPSMKAMLVTVAILVIIVSIVLAITMIPEKVTDCGSDKLCFFEKANACKHATLKIDELGTTYQFETKDCVLTKSIPKISPDEPAEIRDLLEGKSMTCVYKKNNFDSDLINSILVGIDPCQGELKDAIYILAIAQYQVAIKELSEQAEQLETLLNATL